MIDEGNITDAGTGWVIEHGASDASRPSYWAGAAGWSYDNLAAIRFGRAADAESVNSFLVREGYPMATGMPNRICQHAWDDLAASRVRPDGEPFVFVPINRIGSLDTSIRVPLAKHVSAEQAHLWMPLYASPASSYADAIRSCLDAVEAVRVSPQWSGKSADWICGAVRFEIEALTPRAPL